MAETAARVDPLRNFNFHVEIDSIIVGGFMECSGIESTTEVIDFREGGDNTTMKKLPGKSMFSDVTLKRGLTDSTALWDWRQQIIDGDIQRKTVSIVVYDLANQNEVVRWNLTAAWPTKWDGPTLDAKGKDVAVETLVLAHEGITRF